jgi:hypothetical protein
MEVCQKLQGAAVAANCRSANPAGLGAAAIENAEFDLPSVPGHGGAVMRFEKPESLDRTTDAFAAMAMLAGPHRYASRKALMFVQMNSDAPSDVGARAKAVVDAL